jgi:hypothetical protein
LSRTCAFITHEVHHVVALIHDPVADHHPHHADLAGDATLLHQRAAEQTLAVDRPSTSHLPDAAVRRAAELADAHVAHLEAHQGGFVEARTLTV